MTPPDSDQVLSLFSGAGGFSFGFAQAGLKPVCGAEIEKDACASYEANVGSVCHNLDLSSAPPRFFVDILGGRAPFAIIGGPPCQGFTTAGLRNADDPRNKLIFNFLHIISEVRPRWFIFENVEGFLTLAKGQAVSSLLQQFLHIGYSVRLQKVNFAAYGVPQTRKRVIIIGNRLGIDFQFPEETHSFDSGKAKKPGTMPFAPTFDDALAGLGFASLCREHSVAYCSSEPLNYFDALMRTGNKRTTVSEHFHTTSNKDATLYSLLKPGQTMKDLPEEYWPQSFKRRAFRRVMDGTPTEKRGGAPSGIKRLRGNLQSLTITGAASREFIHSRESRPLTIRECARIQTFPDCYEFKGNVASVTQQIGNAVPPLAALVFARYLKRLDGLHGSGLQVSQRDASPRLLGFVLTDSAGMSDALKSTEAYLTRLIQKELAFA